LGGLLGAARCEHDERGLREDPEVEPERPRARVLEVEREPAIELVDLAAAADLPQARDPWNHGKSLRVISGVLLDLARHRRTRADQAHVALEHVEQLRHLVDAELAKHRPEPA